MDEAKEAELVRSARMGDREAFRSLVRHYQREVYRLAFALTRHQARATDLARESFERAWTGLSGLPEGKPFVPWVLRIARNLSVAHARRYAGTPIPVAILHESATDEEREAADLARRVLEGLRELRPDEQMALALRVVERLRYEEMAALLDHPIGLTLARLSTARGVLLSRVSGKDEGAS